MINENEKKYIYAAFAMIGIILIVVLIMIWAPMITGSTSFSKTITSTSFYNDDDYINEMKEKYKYVVKDIIDIDKFNNSKELLNENYLNDYNLDKNSAQDYLINNNLLTHVSNSTVIYSCGVKQDSKKYIFSYKYLVGESEKMVHIIEDYYGKYTVSFDQEKYPIVNVEGYTVEKDGLVFKITPFESYENSLVLNFEVINNTTEEYIFEVNSINNSNVIYNNSNLGYLSTVVVGTDSSNILSQPGGSVTFKLSYNIPLENQCDINEIDFNKVKRNNGEEQMISLLI